MATSKRGDLLQPKELIEEGNVASVIDRTYPLGEFSEAMRHLNEGQVRGKLVIITGGEDTSRES